MSVIRYFMFQYRYKCGIIATSLLSGQQTILIYSYLSRCSIVFPFTFCPLTTMMTFMWIWPRSNNNTVSVITSSNFSIYHLQWPVRAIIEGGPSLMNGLACQQWHGMGSVSSHHHLRLLTGMYSPHMCGWAFCSKAFPETPLTSHKDTNLQDSLLKTIINLEGFLGHLFLKCNVWL